MSSQSLVGRVVEPIVKVAKKIAYELSYQTGVGWKYGSNEGYFDRFSRGLQRDGVFPEGTPNTPYREAMRDIEQHLLSS